MSIGLTELALILVIALLLFGGKRLPELARGLGRVHYEYKKAKNMLQNETRELKEAIDGSSEKSDQK